MKPSFHSAAHNFVNGLAAELPLEAAAFTSAAQAYAQDFVERCAACADDTRVLIDVKTSLRKIKGFSLRDFDKLVREEKGKIFGAGRAAKNGANGHAVIDWRSMLAKNSAGVPKPRLSNAMLALRHAPEWQGVLAYNQLSNRLSKRKSPPFPSSSATQWSDTDDIKTAEWLQLAGIEIGVTTAANAVAAVGEESSFHPVRDYLTGLKWDGEKRVCRWAVEYLGVPFSEFAAQAGAKWLISAVARVMRPGCQADYCLILEGPQGKWKSSALRTLASDEWFTDQIADPTNIKESSQDVAGKWIVEIGEIDKYSRHEQGIIKSFIPRRTDHYRPSYGRHSQDFDRQCVFSATTNKESYLGDETGGRRYWPVRCGEISLNRLLNDRDQLWAEALHLFLTIPAEDSPWWFPRDSEALATSAQSDRYESDAWDKPVYEWILEDERKYTINEGADAEHYSRSPEPYFIQTDSILELCLKRSIGTWTKPDKDRVAKILTFHGFERFQRRVTTIDGIPVTASDGKQRREWYYRRKP